MSAAEIVSTAIGSLALTISIILAVIEIRRFRRELGRITVTIQGVNIMVDGTNVQSPGMLLVTLLVINEGGRPVAARTFDLFLRNQHNQHAYFERMQIPPGDQFKGSGQVTTFNEDPHEQDLMMFKDAFMPGMPYYGYLLFRSREHSGADLQGLISQPGGVMLVLEWVDTSGQRQVENMKLDQSQELSVEPGKRMVFRGGPVVTGESIDPDS